MPENLDLWGDPIPDPVEKRGRPPHVVTHEKRIRVSVLVAVHKTQAEIAAALGISEPTLRAKYSSELKHGLAQKRAEILVRLWAAAEKGNVAAMKAYIAECEKSDLIGRRVPSRVPKLGKKAQAQVDAAVPDVTTSMGELMAKRADELKLLH